MAITNHERVGTVAFERVRTDDEGATSPGDTLRELFNEYGIRVHPTPLGCRATFFNGPIGKVWVCSVYEVLG